MWGCEKRVQNFGEEFEGKGPLGRPVVRLKDDIKMGAGEIP
jgi:hypothetical protein